MATTKNEMLDALLQRMDDALAKGERLPWQKPWAPQYGELSAPHNPTTGKIYSPLNGLILSTAAMEHGYEDPRWMGFNQAKEQGWSVRRGEHAAARVFSPIIKKEIDPKTGFEESRVAGYRSAPLFNAVQIDGIPPMQPVPEQERLPKTAELDAIAKQMGVAILHSGSAAIYSPIRDTIYLPHRHAFTDQHGYDATKAHELAHATGHESRLNRNSLMHRFLPGRAVEEMTAEIGAYILSTRLGVPVSGNDPDMTDEQHAAYLASWAKDLSTDDRRAAIEQGIKAAEYMAKQLELAREKGLVVEMGKERVMEASPEPDRKVAVQSSKTLSDSPHKVILTHRTDLKDYHEDLTVYHPRREITGTLKDFGKSEFFLDTKEFGEVSVETGKNMFADRADELKEFVGKPVDIGLNKTGTVLSLAAHDGQSSSIRLDNFDTPAIPLGLMPAVNLNGKKEKPVTGKLTHVHDSNVVELRSAGEPVLVYGREPEKEQQAEMQKMIGKQVRVSADKDTGVLIVKAVQPTRGQEISGLER